jgi:phosphoribosyl 1,2-cyclic phosphodiesterase
VTLANSELTRTEDFMIKFWGVRGQIPTPGRETLRYGGNTPCLEMQVAEKCLIFDGGTGLRHLGNHLLKQMPVEAHIFFTHCHWDRIQGFPFFIPAFIPGNCFHIYGTEAANGSSFQERLESQMHGPNFPVPMQVMRSELKFHALEINAKEDLGNNVIVETNLLNDAHHSLGYRVSYQDKSVAYTTDTGNDVHDLVDNFIALAKNVDLLILDAPSSITADSFDEQVSLWQKDLQIASEAGAKQIIISPHNPDDDDQLLEQLEIRLQLDFPSLILAREGMLISVN